MFNVYNSPSILTFVMLMRVPQKSNKNVSFGNKKAYNRSGLFTFRLPPSDLTIQQAQRKHAIKREPSASLFSYSDIEYWRYSNVENKS